ncbi:dTDP-4-dehydrorhamnose reductase [Shewanella sp. VB17]|uniref:dTDP-4-dehydrorhamnose reductase n=1 Tax=Shewanella sp. VB17 TaxID=2739432 RepID=UPI0015653597|nr:dTDP-4-dehydrorhamnose reductase [Shewanella sp. VB17]NRD72367.1 dTDP-4-dehydrorhamnose reductase [Shewanella sp. VB17]
MKVLITGCKGQLGNELRLSCPPSIEAIYTHSTELDITNEITVLSFITDFNPDVVINAAAYTAVDKAEADKDAAYAVNAAAVGYLAKACKQNNVRLIQVSTDFVFNGNSVDGMQLTPYLPEDTVNPLSVYGDSKYQGEQLLQQEMSDKADSFAIVRTSWLYSSQGNNFVKTMLRLMNEKDHLGIVADQYGAPTWAANLASICWQLAQRADLNGIFHYSNATGSDQGISWYDFACGIQVEGIKQGLLNATIPLNAIITADYPTPAMRPAYSVMNCSKLNQALNIEPNDWKESLAAMMKQLS